MKNKLFKKGYISFMIIILLILPSLAFASDGGDKTEMDMDNKLKENTEETIGDKNFDPNSHIEKEEGEVFSPSIDKSVPNSKIPSPSNKGLVKGGNEKAINSLATKENKARGTVIENVSRGGGPLDPVKVPKIESNISNENNSSTQSLQDNPVDIRQFLTFQTSSGKTFHLIIDHEKNQDNVQLLTEVGEQDLLNMIEGPKEDKTQLKEEIEPIKETENTEEPKTEDKEEPKKKSKSGLLMVLMALIVGGAGYYFKIYKGNQEDDSDDYYEEDDYDDSEYEDEDEFEKEGSIDKNDEDQ
ncbi:CD1107 family mobile element protein [Senegalia sp. (in: firmicutes)]|uniref:CD1107 family mobile element protein n=1 Tax=Senegalia sp. (in: firmicutes) TaxID=1924098 RepID=UPI003F9B5D16